MHIKSRDTIWDLKDNTNINIINFLQTVQDLNVIHGYNQTSEEWLRINGMEAKKLNIESLFTDGKLLGYVILEKIVQVLRLRLRRDLPP